MVKDNSGRFRDHWKKSQVVTTENTLQFWTFVAVDYSDTHCQVGKIEERMRGNNQ